MSLVFLMGIGTWNSPKGYHLTIGYDIVPGEIQFLSRWDHVDFDKINYQGSSDWLVLGMDFWPTSVTEIQINYIVDTDYTSFKSHQILFNSQIAL
jgi:hypothetical protein